MLRFCSHQRRQGEESREPCVRVKAPLGERGSAGSLKTYPARVSNEVISENSRSLLVITDL